MHLGLVIRPNSKQEEWRNLEHSGSIWSRKATFGLWAMSDRLIRQNEQSTLGLVSAFNKCTIFHLHKLVLSCFLKYFFRFFFNFNISILNILKNYQFNNPWGKDYFKKLDEISREKASRPLLPKPYSTNWILNEC